MTQAPVLKSFEEVYKTAYSHGLENIYALENVDIKTVRPLNPSIKTNPAKKFAYLCPSHLLKNKQLTFNFGLSYKGTTEPFVLKEPLQVLGLTRYIENTLLGQGKRLLRDLVQEQITGFGQGHIDEIQQKLEEYLGGRHLQKATTIDFMAWLKSIVADIDRKKLGIALEPFGLSSLFSLSVGENVEVKRLTFEKKMEWREEVEALLSNEKKKLQVDKDFCEITEVFIKPWMSCRHDIAAEWELQERLIQLSEDCAAAISCLNFFKKFFFKNDFPLKRYLEPLGEGLFASDGWVAEHHDQIIEKALTYFYQPDTVYPYATLMVFLEREFAHSWTSFREGFIAKILLLSPRFRVFKNFDSILFISLA